MLTYLDHLVDVFFLWVVSLLCCSVFTRHGGARAHTEAGTGLPFAKQAPKRTMMKASEIDAMVNCQVELHSIKAKPELNGQRGTIVGFVGLSGRFEIRLAGAAADAALLALQAKNLTAILPKYTKVVLDGLKSKPELNGVTAEVVSWNEKAGRFNVKVPGSDEPIALKEENLLSPGAASKAESSAAAAPSETPPAEEASPDSPPDSPKASSSTAGKAPDSPTNVADAPPLPPQPNADGYYAGVNVTQERKEADLRAVLDNSKDPHEGLRVRAREDNKTKRTRMQNQLGTSNMFIKP